jgi:hypothetical protein
MKLINYSLLQLIEQNWRVAYFILCYAILPSILVPIQRVLNDIQDSVEGTTMKCL